MQQFIDFHILKIIFLKLKNINQWIFLSGKSKMFYHRLTLILVLTDYISCFQ